MQHTKAIKAKITSAVEHIQDIRLVGLLLFLAILLMISWSSVRVIETNYRLEQQISEAEQQNRVQQLTNDNLRLHNQYYETEQYLDISARQHFGLAGDGETVLSVPKTIALRHTIEPFQSVEEQQADPALSSKQPAYQRNFQAWIDFFLHRER